MQTYEWTADDLAGQEWAEAQYLARKRERIAREKAARERELLAEVQELRVKVAALESERQGVTA